MRRFSHFSRFVAWAVSCAGAAILAGCGNNAGEEVTVGIIAEPGSIYKTGLRLSPAAQTYRAAIASGLVGFDENALVVPALAESWIVTDDGRSYIFRLRTGEWRDGEQITARAIAAALQRRIIALSGTTLDRDFDIVRDVRAMAGRVIEIRLKAPMPQFLNLLAQPELAIADGPDLIGPMVAARQGLGGGEGRGETVLTATDPQALGMPVPRRWEDMVRPIRVMPVSARGAVQLFVDGDLDVVLGGTIENYPLAPSGALTRGTVRIDAAQGLFGLRVLRPAGLLALPQGREALSLAIDREGLMASFNISGWAQRAVPVPPDISRLTADQSPSWLSLGLEERRAIAQQRVAQWRSENGLARPRFTVAMPAGPGADRIFRALSGDMISIGVSLRRVAMGQAADLVLIDRVARYPAARWYLNQLSCGAPQIACSAYADSLVEEALDVGNAAQREQLLAEAEAELVAAEVFINFGQPLRWSLARASTTGIAPNITGYHPLPPLGVIPN